VAVNCRALAPGVLESELFGHERGAFTGAERARAGLFERAAGGTLFLDEIGDTSLDFQAKLLRVLQDRHVLRVGGGEERPVDFRLVAASNRELRREVEGGRFREDLYFRLAVITIHVPPLRDRGSDVGRLAEHFLRRYCDENGRRHKSLTPAALALLSQYAWPGNVRELRNMMERAVIMLDEDRVDAPHLRPLLLVRDEAGAPPSDSSLRDSLESYERRMIEKALAASDGNIAQAARSLGLDRANLHRKLRRFGLLKRSDTGTA
jgi:transcriptional regulator with PAS, ATPase and Fis domain